MHAKDAAIDEELGEARPASRELYVARMDVLVRQGFIRKVYGILTLQLLWTFSVVALLSLNPTVAGFVARTPGVLGATLALYLGSFLALVCCGERAQRTVPTNYYLLAAFTVATAHQFDGLTNPHVPSYIASARGPVPEFMRRMKPLTAWEMQRENTGFRNRSSSAVDLDRMLGVVMDGLEAAGVMDNTFIWFTSDNGYHLGEHEMVFGKGEPYDTDIRLPFYARGPGVPRNGSQPHPTTHVDIAATVLQLAGAAPAGEPLDGLSFASVLSAAPPAAQAWRNHSFSEFFGPFNTWASLRFPLASGAVRAKVTQWCTNDTEVFDLGADPWEMANIGAGAGAQLLNDTLPLLAALARCKGGLCRHPAPSGAQPLPCRTNHVDEGAPLYDA